MKSFVTAMLGQAKELEMLMIGLTTVMGSEGSRLVDNPLTEFSTRIGVIFK